MDMKKRMKQGRNERTQEAYPTSAKTHSRCRVVFLRSLVSALFLNFFHVLGLSEMSELEVSLY